MRNNRESYRVNRNWNVLLRVVPPRRMLNKSLFSPTQPKRAETRLLPCIVLAHRDPQPTPEGTPAALLNGILSILWDVRGKTPHSAHTLVPSLAISL